MLDLVLAVLVLAAVVSLLVDATYYSARLANAQGAFWGRLRRRRLASIDWPATSGAVAPLSNPTGIAAADTAPPEDSNAGPVSVASIRPLKEICSVVSRQSTAAP